MTHKTIAVRAKLENEMRRKNLVEFKERMQFHLCMREFRKKTDKNASLCALWLSWKSFLLGNYME